MSFDVAKRAIDYYLLHSKETKIRYISFYGGEPLLNFNLIEKCAHYLRKKCSNIKFGLTTNGILLNKDVIAFLERNSFVITISLDGPKELHDKYRIDVNGQGSYDKCYENFKKLYVAFSDPHRININISLGPDKYLFEQFEYFEKLSRDYNCNLNLFVFHLTNAMKRLLN